MQRLDGGGWDPAPRLTLFDAWSGVCTAAYDWTPPEATQREVCNCGYARGSCGRFPAGEAADAVRFSLLRERLIYVLEKDHAPIEHGEIDPVTDPREPLASQARAFLESWRSLLPRTVS
ncbi:MAG: hypothetical protein EXQ47_02845 [Bryobacterales bacterium]|nr:hypothetical protein [Bryobacterales bacterium]